MSIDRTGDGGELPTATIVPYTAASAPSGWVVCDATAYDGTTATYAALWAIIGTTYGGTGQSSFKVPDLRGRTAVGSGTGTASGATAKTLGSTPTSGAGGEETHLLTGAESGTTAHTHSMPSTTHTHPVTAHFHGYRDYRPGGSVAVTVGGAYSLFVAGYLTDMSRTTTPSVTVTNSSDSTGMSVNNSSAASAASAHNIMQPFVVVNYIIKL